MQTFEYVRAKSAQEVVKLLAGAEGEARGLWVGVSGGYRLP